MDPWRPRFHSLYKGAPQRFDIKQGKRQGWRRKTKASAVCERHRKSSADYEGVKSVDLMHCQVQNIKLTSQLGAGRTTMHHRDPTEVSLSVGTICSVFIDRAVLLFSQKEMILEEKALAKVICTKTEARKP